MTFAHAIAEIISVDRQYARVRCPHCGGEHAHRRDYVGSSEVLAACSAPGRPRTYALPGRSIDRTPVGH